MSNNYLNLYEKLMVLERLLHRQNERARKKHGPLADPTVGQGKILALLKENGQMSLKELATLLGIRPQSLNEQIKKLERGGYIERHQSKKDKRVIVVSLSKKGAQEKQAMKNYEDIFEGMTPEEIEALEVQINRIIRNLEREIGEEPLPPHLRGEVRPPRPDEEPLPPHLREGAVPPEPVEPPYPGEEPLPPHFAEEPLPPHLRGEARPPHPAGEPLPPHLRGEVRPPHPAGEPLPPHLRGEVRPPHPAEEPLPPHLRGEVRPPRPDEEPLPPHLRGEVRPPRPDEEPLPPHLQDEVRPPQPVPAEVERIVVEAVNRIVEEIVLRLGAIQLPKEEPKKPEEPPKKPGEEPEDLKPKIKPEEDKEEKPEGLEADEKPEEKGPEEFVFDEESDEVIE